MGGRAGVRRVGCERRFREGITSKRLPTQPHRSWMSVRARWGCIIEIVMEGEPLSDSELRTLDGDLDSHVADQPLFREERSVALAHVLYSFEDAISALPAGEVRTEQAGVNLLDGLHFAVLWCFKYCPVSKIQPDLSFKARAAAAARAMLRAASQYSKVFDLMSIMRRNMGAGRRGEDGTIRVSIGEPEAQLVLLAGRLTGRTSLPEAREDIRKARDSFSEGRFRITAHIRKVSKHAIRYEVPTELFDAFALQQRSILRHSWDLDETWDLGGYTVRQFRDFWVAVTALAWIHSYACSASGSNAEVRDSVLRVKTRHRWESEISKYSGLERTVTGTILNDVTFDPKLYGDGKPRPDLLCQPFIPIGADLLVVSSWLVRLINSEAALWHLLSIIRPDVHSVIRNKKERFWLSELIPNMTDYGLHASGPHKFTYCNQSGDLDLLAVDEARCFAVAFQLKWLKPPEDVRDRDNQDRELRRGIDQAALALKWLRSIPSNLAGRSGLSEETLRALDYSALVLSKNTLGTGYLPTGIAVINEPLVQYTLGTPHRRSLRDLYRVATERRYLPQPGVHFVWKDLTASFGGIQFVGEGFGADLMRHWDPLIDLDLSDLN
jgi:hypothetical protein